MRIYDIQEVKQIDWKTLDISPLGGEMAGDLIVFLNRAMKYSTHAWWKERAFHKQNKENYLTLKSNSERWVLPMANMARAMATILRFNIFDGEEARCTYQKAQDIAMKMLRTLSYNYIANIANGWKAIAIAADTAVAGLIMWDKLNKADKMLFINMLDYAASELIDAKADFRYVGAAEDARNKGVSVNAARAKVLGIAALMMPTHEKATKWQAKANFYQKASTASPSDSMRGYNVTEEGLVIGRGAIDVEEILSVAMALDNALPYLLMQVELPKGIVGSSEKVYASLNNLYLSRAKRTWQPLYMRNIDGELQVELNTPVKAKYDKMQTAQTYLLDVMAFAFNLDTICEIKSRLWAEARMNKITRFQSSHSYGNYFTAVKGRNWGKEAKVQCDLSCAYAMLYFKVAGRL